MTSFGVFLGFVVAAYGLAAQYAHGAPAPALLVAALISVLLYGGIAWALKAAKYRELKELEHEALNELATCISAYEKQFGTRPILSQHTEDKLQHYAHFGHQLGHILTHTTSGAWAGAGVGVAVHATAALMKHAARYFTTTPEQREAEAEIQSLAEAAESAGSDATGLRVAIVLACSCVAAAVFIGAYA
jgi:hypothetical protein